MTFIDTKVSQVSENFLFKTLATNRKVFIIICNMKLEALPPVDLLHNTINTLLISIVISVCFNKAL